MIIRTQKGESPFVQIDKRPLEDPRLSWRAKGIWAYLLSKPNGWTVQTTDLINHASEGRDAVRAAMGELRDLGYAELLMTRGNAGEATGKEWIIHEMPIGTERRKDGKSGFPSTSNNDLDSKNNPSIEGERGRARVNDVVTASNLAGYVFPDSLETPEFRSAVEDWRAYKTGECRVKFTRPMLTRLITAAIKRGAVQYAADIRFSIEKTYQGIFPDRSRSDTLNGTAKKEAALGWSSSVRVEPGERPVTEEQRQKDLELIQAQKEKIKRGGAKSQYEQPA